ncbi:MAG: (p)ppGpp synthetase SpoT/RelA [Phycisphaerales bacterium]|nr:(p)ppGpp synthetase SpoT/RelA [Phycisphaerales bacterium]
MRLAHVGQKRKDGRPHATHPAAVRDILVAEFGVTAEDVLVAALLHDVANETRVPMSEIEERFGEAVTGRLRLLANVGRADSSPDALTPDVQGEVLEAPDLETRQIKVAELIHNLRDKAGLGPEAHAECISESERLAAGMLAGTPGVEVLNVERERARAAATTELG